MPPFAQPVDAQPPGHARSMTSITGKLLTAMRLVCRFEIRQFLQRFGMNFRSWRLKRALGVPFVYRLNGVPVVCIPGNSESEEHFRTSRFDFLELELLRRWLEPDDAFIDVGANLGFYSFAASHFLDGRGTVVAIEASPALQPVLRDSARMLGLQNVAFVSCAAGDAAREVSFYPAHTSGSTAEQSIYADPSRPRAHEAIRIPMRTLADIVGEYPAAREAGAVKVDIEGAEPLALSAAPQAWFTDSGPLWIVEVNPVVLARGGRSANEVIDYFPETAFERWLAPQFGKQGDRLLPMRRLAAGETFTDAWLYNLIAIPLGEVAAHRRQRIKIILAKAQRAPRFS